MIYVLCGIIGAAVALGTVAVLLRFQKTGDAVKHIVEKISKYKAKSSLGELNEAYIEILKY